MRPNVRLFPHIFRLFIAGLIAAQLSFTAGPSASWASHYICNPSGQTLVAAEITQLKALFEAAGKPVPDNTPPSEHCEKCLTSLIAALEPLVSFEPQSYETARVNYRTSYKGFQYLAQGPPLGGRAPPSFL